MPVIKIINSENKFIGSLQNLCFYVSVSNGNFYVRIQLWNQLSYSKDQANTAKP